MRIKFEGIDEYAAKLRALEKESNHICHEALYEGVKVVADAIKAEVNTIPTRAKNEKSQVKTGLTEVQKQGLRDGVGVTRHEDDQFGVNAKVGFIGYNNNKTKKYPNGQPNALIARSICKGTSYLARDAFVKRAVSKVKAQANKAMSDALIKRIEDITK